MTTAMIVWAMARASFPTSSYEQIFSATFDSTMFHLLQTEKSFDRVAARPDSD
jgi:hypothetical protein